MEWYKKVMNNYANFNGRARRKEYWMFVLFFMIIYLVPYLIGGALVASGSESLGLGFMGLSLLLLLAHFIPLLAVTIRRMHDTGNSGWFMLIPFYSFYLRVIDGDPRTNKYGESPKGSTDLFAD